MPTLREELPSHLSKHGRSTVSEIANRTGYSTSHVRDTGSAMVHEGTIEGEKIPKRIPAVIIDGNFHVLSGAKDELIRILEVYASHLVPKAQTMTVSQIQDLIADELADRTLAIERPVWNFWA